MRTKTNDHYNVLLDPSMEKMIKVIRTLIRGGMETSKAIIYVGDTYNYDIEDLSYHLRKGT